MKGRLLLTLALGAASLWGQRITDQRNAEIRGGGGEGKCTIEVWVDDRAAVEIQGGAAILRTYSGAPASFRRFVCNQPMPYQPSGFRFRGIDGRGRQELVRSAESGGPAVVRIEDFRSGGEGYTFDIFWRGGRGYGNGFYRSGDPGRDGWGGGNGRGWNDDWNNDSWGNSNWNNGWGDGSGWAGGGDFRFEGGNRGCGRYRDSWGGMRRLDRARVFVERSGAVFVSFDGDRGRLDFSGRVLERHGRRLISEVRGAGLAGTMEIEMGRPGQVSRIFFRDADLNWAY